MRLFPLICGVVLLTASAQVAAPTAAKAQEARPIQVSLVNPIQIFGEDEDITGLRLNILYGRNRNVKGVDFGWIAGHNTGDGKGLQWNGIANITDGSFEGWQWGLVDLVGGNFTGLQVGLFTRHEGTGEGVQLGFVNVANDMSGLQFGIVNVTQRMNGLQIGLVNVIKSKDKLPILPLVNWNF